MIVFKDKAVQPVIAVVEQLIEGNQMSSATAFRVALEQHFRFTNNKDDQREVQKLYAGSKNVVARKAISNAYNGEHFVDPCVEGDCGDTKTVKTNLELAVKESVPAESNEVETVVAKTDEEMVKTVQDIYKYTSPSQIALHFGSGVKDDKMVIGNMKNWAKVTEPPLFHKIKMLNETDIVAASERMYKYLSNLKK